jgi:hypothetical protein
MAVSLRGAMGTSTANALTRQTAFDYDRTLVAFHGTRRSTAKELVRGDAFGVSENDDDWLGHGIYFWEFAPQQAWWWARRRYGDGAAVVGALIRLGQCLDLLDPSNALLLRAAHDDLERMISLARKRLPENANNHKYLDCAVFNYAYGLLDQDGRAVDSCRAVFVPLKQGKMPRLWRRSGVFGRVHVQLCVRTPSNILAVWPVRKDGRYGEDE